MNVFNAAEFLVHRHVRGGVGQKTAMMGSYERTYRQLSDDVARLASGLRGLGLRRDDRGVLVMSDDVEMATTILAAFHAGLVAVPISTMLNGHELSEITRDAGARAVIATPEFLDAVVGGVHASTAAAHRI